MGAAATRAAGHRPGVTPSGGPGAGRPGHPPPLAVGVVGASARAAAHSLVRAGFAPWAVDLFADRDLRLVAPCVRCPLADYPAALPALAEQFPPGPVMYTGGLENHPDVVAELARRRLVLGNSPDVLGKARDPELLSGPEADGFATLYSRSGLEPVRATGRWLAKPLRSCGGLGVRFAETGEVVGPNYYLQEFADGPPMSAQFVAIDAATTPLGVTEQLVGEPWLHAGPFAYCGTVGPAVVSGELRAILVGLGEYFGRAAGLRGIWGLDFVLRDGHPYPIEINPRYTAALEVLEHTYQAALLTRTGATTHKARRVVGKAIYYAPCPITFPAAGPWNADLVTPFEPWRLPGYADIPDPGEPIEPGQPVLTFFAAGSTAEECRATLKEKAAKLDRLFGWEGQS